ncbi:uncharacterized protein NECHADRAFT_86887 [Fusarium vanettenii 77-13-4]|uniref:Ubiquitin-like protease family profile domain-containing protein n=1 Tax=Fusarium vanettenii (strain ATCC MYA-4622 / CBS 123669 / FGSC 9596 / NRRL 45880 / 77-13-4) TaxID=660122 RepID=C7ZHW4_FUSV7|nr:uncharacterized protein NECHADRAFT_86887 [Fusarium vanettenii 77-13-4]EEU36351.1 predicted protein [Fusarium vanettenii 77-13-4]
MNSPPTERSASGDIHFMTTHDERVFWLDQAWKGPWFPADARIGWLGTDSSLAFYMVKVTHAAIDRGIPLDSLWDAESPHGHLIRAVMKKSTTVKNSEGSQPDILTPEIVTKAYEIIMASEKTAPNNTPSEHSSDKSDDGGSIDLPHTTETEAQATTTARFEQLVKTEHEFRLKRPIEQQDGLSAMPLHIRHEDQSSPLKRLFRTTSYVSTGTLGHQPTREATAITGIATQEEPIEKNLRSRPAPEAYMGSPDLSTRSETFVSPHGLLQLPSSPVQSPEHNLLPYVSSPPADEQLEKAPTPTSPTTPTKKRKRDLTSASSPLARSVRSERLTGPLTVEKILRQLTCDVQLTDDVVELVCQAIVVEHGGDNVRVLSPLWFEADELSALPQTIRNLDQEQTICFPIHHKFPKHWTMGVARVTADQVVLTFHDSMQSSERANAVRRRFKEWMKTVKLKQPLAFQTKDCTQQKDGTSCGVHAAVCLRRDLRNESCCDPIEPFLEKRAMLEGLRTVREISPIHSTTFPLLRELRSRESLGADASIVSTPCRGGNTMPITTRQESEVQVIQPQMGLGHVLDGLRLETLQGRLKDAENRLDEAINSRDNAQDTLRELELSQRLIHDMYPRILSHVRSCGINMDEYSDATMAVERNGMPEGMDPGEIFQQRRNIMGDFLKASEREGVDHTLAAIRENQAQIFADIGHTQQILGQRNEEITSIENEVASLEEICEAKKALKKYSGPEFLAYFQSMQGLLTQY